MICQACGATFGIVVRGPRMFTCSEACHAMWIDRLVAQYGELREITSLETGKVHIVPTRLILEVGITGSDLARYPEKGSTGNSPPAGGVSES